MAKFPHRTPHHRVAASNLVVRRLWPAALGKRRDFASSLPAIRLPAICTNRSFGQRRIRLNIQDDDGLPAVLSLGEREAMQGHRFDVNPHMVAVRIDACEGSVSGAAL